MDTAVTLLNESGRWLVAQLGRMSVELAILAGIVLVALYVLRVKSPALRHLFWGLLLAKPVVTFLVASPLSLYAVLWPPAPQAVYTPPPVVVQAEPVRAPLPMTPVPQAAPPAPAPAPKTPPLWRQVDRYGLASAIWMTVASMLGLRLLLGCAYVAFLRTTARTRREDLLAELVDEAAATLRVRRRVSIATTTVCHGPVLAGIFRPVILLPESMADALTRAQLKLVVTHELAHARRWDNFVLLVQRLAEMLFFFHPVVWLCGWMMRREAEAACDDMVVSAYGDADGAGAAAYADSLTRVAEMKCGITRRLLVNTFAAAESNFHRRIRRILSGRRTRMTLWLSLATGAALILIGILGLPAASAPKDNGKDNVLASDAVNEKCRELDVSQATPKFRELLEKNVTVDFDDVHLATAIERLNTDYYMNAVVDWRVIAPEQTRPGAWYAHRRHDGGHLHNIHDKNTPLKNVLMGLAMVSIGHATIEVGPNVAWITRKEMADSDAQRLRPSIEGASPAVRDTLQELMSCGATNIHLDEILRHFSVTPPVTFDVDYHFVPPLDPSNTVKDETHYVTDGFLPSLRLALVPKGEALEVILRSLNLTYRCEGDVIHITGNGGIHPEAWWTQFTKERAEAAEKSAATNAKVPYFLTLSQDGGDLLSVPVEESAAKDGKKTGTYDAQSILRDFKDREKAYEGLQTEVEKLQKDVDQKSQAVKEEKEKLEKERGGLSEQEAAARKEHIDALYKEYQDELKANQQTIDEKEKALLEPFAKEMKEAAKKAADELGCGDVKPESQMTGKDAAETVDLTLRIREILGDKLKNRPSLLNIQEGPDGPRAQIATSSTGAEHWYKTGDAFEQFQLKEINKEAGTALIGVEGEKKDITLKMRPQKAQEAAPVSNKKALKAKDEIEAKWDGINSYAATVESVNDDRENPRGGYTMQAHVVALKNADGVLMYRIDMNSVSFGNPDRKGFDDCTLLYDGKDLYREVRTKEGTTIHIRRDVQHVEFSNGAIGLRRNFEQCFQNDAFTLLPEEEVGGKGVYVFEGRSKRSQKVAPYRVCIDKETGFQLKFERGHNRSVLSDVKLNVPVDPALFKYTPPADAKIEDSAAPEKVNTPATAYVTPEGGYTHLVTFEPAGDFQPEHPKELLDVFNGVCKARTGYFRTKPQDGKLVGRICTDKPEEVQKALEQEPRLKWVESVPLTAELFAQHDASKQESLPENAAAAAPRKVEMLPLNVRVVDESGAPVADATVRPYAMRASVDPGSHYGWRTEDFGESREVASDAQGNARIVYPKYVEENKATGKVTVVVTHPDFVVKHQDLSVDEAAPVITLTRGTKVRVSGYVGAKENAAWPVHVLTDSTAGFNGDRWQENGKALENGQFTAGKHQVWLINQPKDGPVLFSDLVSFETSPDKVAELAVELHPGIRVEGRIDDTLPRPIRNGRVEILVASVPPGKSGEAPSPSVQYSAQAPMGEDGRFVFESLPKGYAEIAAWCDGGIVSFTGGSGPESLVHPLPVNLTAPPAEMVVPMIATASATVKANDGQGRPIGGVKVSFWPNIQWMGRFTNVARPSLTTLQMLGMDERSIQTAYSDSLKDNPYMATTGPDGLATVANLPSCAHQFIAANDAYQLPLNKSSMPRRYADIKLAPGKNTAVTVQLDPKQNTAEPAKDQSAGDTAKPSASPHEVPSEKTQVEMTLDSPVSIEFENIHVSDIVEFMSDSYDINIEIDWRAVQPPANLAMTPPLASGSKPVTDGMVPYINLKNVTMREALNALLRPLNLTFQAEPSLVWISSPALIAADAERPQADLKSASEELSKRLQSPVSLEFEKTSLQDITEFMADSYDVNLLLDWRVMPMDKKGENSSRQDTSSFVTGAQVPRINLKNVPMAEILYALLRPLNLTFKADKDMVWISSDAMINAEPSGQGNSQAVAVPDSAGSTRIAVATNESMKTGVYIDSLELKRKDPGSGDVTLVALLRNADPIELSPMDVEFYLDVPNPKRASRSFASFPAGTTRNASADFTLSEGANTLVVVLDPEAKLPCSHERQCTRLTVDYKDGKLSVKGVQVGPDTSEWTHIPVAKDADSATGIFIESLGLLRKNPHGNEVTLLAYVSNATPEQLPAMGLEFYLDGSDAKRQKRSLEALAAGTTRRESATLTLADGHNALVVVMDPEHQCPAVSGKTRVTKLFLDNLNGKLSIKGAVRLPDASPESAEEQKQPAETDTTQVATETSPSVTAEGFVADLGNDRSIQIVSVREHKSDNKSFWQPDGTPLSAAPYDPDKLAESVAGQGKAYEFAIRTKGIEFDEPIQYRFEGSTGWSMAGSSDNEISAIATVCLDAAATTENIGISIASGDWTTDMTEEPQGGSARGGQDSSVIFGETYEKDGAACITVTLEGALSEKAVRLCAVDAQEQLHPSSANGSSAGKAKQTTHRFADLKPQDIQEFQLQTRPWREIRFENISLASGRHTDCRVIVPAAAEENAAKGQHGQKWWGEEALKQIGEHIGKVVAKGHPEFPEDLRTKLGRQPMTVTISNAAQLIEVLSLATNLSFIAGDVPSFEPVSVTDTAPLKCMEEVAVKSGGKLCFVARPYGILVTSVEKAGAIAGASLPAGVPYAVGDQKDQGAPRPALPEAVVTALTRQPLTLASSGPEARLSQIVESLSISSEMSFVMGFDTVIPPYSFMNVTAKDIMLAISDMTREKVSFVLHDCGFLVGEGDGMVWVYGPTIPEGLPSCPVDRPSSRQPLSDALKQRLTKEPVTLDLRPAAFCGTGKDSFADVLRQASGVELTMDTDSVKDQFTEKDAAPFLFMKNSNCLLLMEALVEATGGQLCFALPNDSSATLTSYGRGQTISGPAVELAPAVPPYYLAAMAGKATGDTSPQPSAGKEKTGQIEETMRPLDPVPAPGSSPPAPEVKPAADAGKPASGPLVVAPLIGFLDDKVKAEWQTQGVNGDKAVLEKLQDMTVEIMQKRLESADMKDVQVAKAANSRITVQIPPSADAARVSLLLTQPGMSRFCPADSRDEVVKALQEIEKTLSFKGRMAGIFDTKSSGDFLIVPTDKHAAAEAVLGEINDARPRLLPEGKMFFLGSKDFPNALYLIDKNSPMANVKVQSASAALDADNPGKARVNFTFSEEDAQRFGDLTQSLIGRGLAILVNWEVQSVPIVRAKITKSGQITGNYTPEEAADIAARISLPEYPAQLLVLSDPTGTWHIPEAAKVEDVRKGLETRYYSGIDQGLLNRLLYKFLVPVFDPATGERLSFSRYDKAKDELCVRNLPDNLAAFEIMIAHFSVGPRKAQSGQNKEETAPAGIHEDFEHSTSGINTWPDGWIADGNATNHNVCYVDGETFKEAHGNTLRLQGDTPSWSPLAHMATAVNVPCQIAFDVYLESKDPRCTCVVGVRKEPSWKAPGVILFDTIPPGNVKGLEPVAEGGVMSNGVSSDQLHMDLAKWYHVELLLREEQGKQSLSVTLNDGASAQGPVQLSTDTALVKDMPYLQLEVRSGTAWFDNVSMAPMESPQQSEPARQEISDNIILPGRGLKDIGVGDAAKAVVDRLGEPGFRDQDWLNYREKNGLDFFLVGSAVVKVAFNAGFTGKTPDGVGIGSSLDEAVKASGGVDSTVKVKGKSTGAVAPKDKRQLCEVREHGKPTGFQFTDNAKGISYWTDAEKKIIQIAAFRPNEDREQPFPITVFVFAPRDSAAIADDRDLLDAFNENYPSGNVRTHAYKAATANGRLIGVICSDNAPPIAQMLKDSAKLECLGTHELKDWDAFRGYNGMSVEDCARKFLPADAAATASSAKDSEATSAANAQAADSNVVFAQNPAPEEDKIPRYSAEMKLLAGPRKSIDAVCADLKTDREIEHGPEAERVFITRDEKSIEVIFATSEKFSDLELISAPRVTFKEAEDARKDAAASPLAGLKIVLRATGMKFPADCSHLTTAIMEEYFRDYSPSLLDFLSNDKAMAVIMDTQENVPAERVKSADPELIPEGMAMAIRLDKTEKQDEFGLKFYFNDKEVVQHGRGLAFWKPKPTPEIFESPVVLRMPSENPYRLGEWVIVVTKNRDPKKATLAMLHVERVPTRGSRQFETT